MKIEMIEIVKHKHFPLMDKEIVFKITPDKPLPNGDKSYEQPMCIGWELDIQEGKIKDVNVNYGNKSEDEK